MKFILLIFFGLLVVTINSAMCDLSIDTGPSWSQHNSAYSSWGTTGDVLYKQGKYIEALECYDQIGELLCDSDYQASIYLNH